MIKDPKENRCDKGRESDRYDKAIRALQIASIIQGISIIILAVSISLSH